MHKKLAIACAIAAGVGLLPLPYAYYIFAPPVVLWLLVISQFRDL